MRAAPLLIFLLLTGCFEPASTWDSKRGRFVGTQELKDEQRREIRDIERRLDRIENPRQ